MSRMNDESTAFLRNLIGFTERERRGGSWSRVEKEQMRALILMGLSNLRISQVMRCCEATPRKLRAALGLGSPVRMAKCHPERVHAAKGLCRTCYDRAERLRRPECHPDRPYRAKGLCRSCYQKQWSDSRQKP